MRYFLFGVLLLGMLLLAGLYFNPFPETDTQVSLPAKKSTSTASNLNSLPPLEQRVGRLFMAGHWSHTPVASTTQLIEQFGLAGVIIMDAPTDPTKIRDWVRQWQAAADYPLMIAIDQEGGTVARPRGPDFTLTSQPEITTKEEAFAVAKARGQELAALGINMNFAPVVDASTNSSGFLYQRTFRDPSYIYLLSLASVNGYKASGITGVIKHYPGHPDTPIDPHLDLPILDLGDTTFTEHTESFNELFYMPNLVSVVMTAHVLIPDIDETYPATLSKEILTHELRGKQSYDGIVVTDDMTMDAIDERFTTEKATLLALNAGADLILFAADPEEVRDVIPAVLAAIQAGTVSEATINEHFSRVSEWRPVRTKARSL